MAGIDSNRRGRLFSVESIAGWVFADLLLVLFIVGLGSAVAYTPPEPPKKEPKTIVGMKTDPTPIGVRVDGGRLAGGGKLDATTKKSVCQAVKKRLGPVAGQRAALVLVFGGGPDVSSGQNVARAITPQLGCASSEVFQGKVPTRAFWDGSLPLGEARLEVFLFHTEKQG
ncbi:hypothetical protein [Nocardioides panzhihuensis]|uniref:Uncharacterized protein n=1 Tax=Nocardioides panzhihuensis TaxID=860243 RepID=A0A7Z0DSM5_9ACTN|nr:hypothetical protein [Nocardioides panzhihuensis]NYI80634.1 hypothetical protein [Nocardioides panzhihuensis]